jgi:hypothetical protein
MNLHDAGGGWWDRMKLTEDKDKWQALVSKVKNFSVP